MDGLFDPSIDPKDWVWGLVQGYLNFESLGSLFSAIASQSNRSNLGLVGLGFIGLIVMWIGRKQNGSSKTGKKSDVKLPELGRPGVHRNVFHGHERSVRVGGWFSPRFDIAWRHIGILGTSGARKSTLMAILIEKIGKHYAWITGDHSPPLLNLTLSSGGLVWRPRGDLAWYPWGGPLELAVQRVEHMFPATDNDGGVHRSMFKGVARLAWAPTRDAWTTQLEKSIRNPDQRSALSLAADKGQITRGVTDRGRSVEQILDYLVLIGTGASSKMMGENWSARLQELIDSLGDSLKTGEDGGFDLVEMLRAGIDVGFAMNSFADVSNRQRFAKIAVLETLRAADTLGNLTIGIDEVGLVGGDLFSESVRTLRVRKCTGIFGSHIIKDFPDILRGLITIWFLGQVPGGDKVTRDWCSHTTFDLIPPEHFGDHVLQLGKFYLIAGGRVQKLAVPTWKLRPVEIDNEPPEPIEPWTDGGDESEGAGWCDDGEGDEVQGDIGENEDDEDEYPEASAVPVQFRADPQLTRIYEYVEIKGSHRLSKYAVDKSDGRPRTKYRQDKWMPYALLKAVYEGRDLIEVRKRMADTSLEGLTCDHLCREIDPECSAEDEKRCQEVSHNRWRLRSGNTQVQWDRARARTKLRAVV